MIDAMTSRVRMRDLARPGRFRLTSGVSLEADPRREACASRRESGVEASSLTTALPSRPEAASARPGDGDLMASII
jgi:hypothetical protein